jgi:hypothetical protein
MKKNLFIAALAATALISCKNEEKESEMMEDSTMETEMEMDDSTSSTSTTIVYNETQAAELQRDFSEAVEVKDGKAYNIKGWMIYSNVNEDIKMLNSAKPAARTTAAQKLRSDFDALRNSLPEYMNVRRVRRAIDKIDARITNFEENTAKTDVSEKTIKGDLEDINEAYGNLGEQILKAREQYLDNREDAIEEYLEEINDLDKNKTYEDRLRDAREEYNEEMKQK